MDNVREMTAGIAKGDDASFRSFYDAYFTRLYRYLLVVTGGSEDLARDALQESMIRVIRYMKRFDNADDLWNWLRRIARTAFIDQVRKRQGGMGSVLSLTRLENRLPSMEGENADNELHDLLREGIKKLDPEDRSLIEGKYIHGRSYEDLAKEQALTPKAVESRLARIRKTLKAIMLERLKR
ncbi:MAG: sigma-70 family RNA polymerase sigma factor [Planctomycetota bacterium]